MSTNENVRVPTVARIEGDTIVELVLDPIKKNTALVVSRFKGLWNFELELKLATGELLVPYSGRNNLIANRCVLLPAHPDDYGSKSELLADIEAFLHRYVDLTPVFEKIAAHYVLLTWVHDAFNELPYLRLRGDYGTGKTRGLLAIGSPCYRPFFASGASTTSPIFHTLDRLGGTLVIDEADFRFSDAASDIVKVLNNGNVKGLPVLRTMQNRDKEFNPRAFKVFGPKILAMRGSYDDPALESRFLTEEMGLRPLRPDISIPLPDQMEEEALALRNRLLHYRLCHLFEIKPDTSLLSPQLEARTNQIALPLLSLMDDPDLRAAVVQRLQLEQEERQARRRDSVEGKVLGVVIELTAKKWPVSVGSVASQFNQRHGPDMGWIVSEKWIGNILRNRLRLTTQKSKGVYIVASEEKSKVATLAARYNFNMPNAA